MSKVVIIVSGGMASVESQPPGVKVVIKDYDAEKVEHLPVKKDAHGSGYVEYIYD